MKRRRTRSSPSTQVYDRGGRVPSTSPHARRLLFLGCAVAGAFAALAVAADLLERSGDPNRAPDRRDVVALALPSLPVPEFAASPLRSERLANEAPSGADESAENPGATAATDTSGIPPRTVAAAPAALDSGLPTQDDTGQQPVSEDLVWRTIVVEAGDSLFVIFKRNGFPVRLVHGLVSGSTEGKQLNRLRPGQSIEVGTDSAGKLLALIAPIGNARKRFSRSGEDFVVGEAAPTRPTATEQPDASQPSGLIAVGSPTQSPDDHRQRAPRPEDNKQTDITVVSGDSFYLLFKRQGFSEAEFAAISADSNLRDELTRIHPGQRFVFHAAPDGALNRLDYDIDPERSLRVERVGKAFRGRYVETELEVRETSAKGVISSSLFISGQGAGLSDNMIMKLADIFAWDVDFALDIRSGDEFSVIYTELFKDGNKVKDGTILAAEFINKNRTIRALRFQRDDGRIGYFTPDGDSMRKAFLRTPVEFSRISSGFDLNRLHPVLHSIRAHRGVDYAAPRGTPVRTTGDGKIAFAGRKGGYGKTVIIRHGGTYTTLYAHLHNMARGIRTGAVVSQGQVIGYVGSTGLATGPHLHYEFRVNGAHKNPVTVALPKALPIEPEYKQAFSVQTRDLLARLDLLARTQVASSAP